ncbi:MAG: hypothetical protein ABSB28_01120 [Candidatus Bathyarchaeia archaeon]
MSKSVGKNSTGPEAGYENRFMALEEIELLLRSRHVKLEDLFDVLGNSDDGCLDFNIGDIAIQFVRGFGVWSDRRDVIQVTAELLATAKKGNVSEMVGYEYTFDELRRLRSEKLAKIECSGEE